MALGLAGGGVSHYGTMGSHLCGSHSPSWTQGSPAGTGGQKHGGGLGGLLGKAAGAAEGRPAWTKGVSCLICSSPPVSPREGHLRGLSTNPEHLWGWEGDCGSPRKGYRKE